MAFVFEEEEELQSPNKRFVFEEEEKLSPRESLIKSTAPIEEFAQQFGKGLGGEVGAAPRTFAELLSYGSKFLAQKGEEQQEDKGTPLSDKDKKITQRILKGMDFPLKILDKIGYPSKERIEEIMDSYSQATGQDVPSDPQSSAGRFGKRTGEFAAYALPGKGATLPGRLATSLLGGVGAQGAEELGLGEGGQVGASIALPVATHIAQALLTKKFTPTSEENKKLAQFFRQQGLSEGEVTTLLQPSRKVDILGKAAKGTKTAGILKTDVPGILEGIEKKLGSSYESLKEQAAILPEASRKSMGKVLEDFQSVITTIDKSHMPGADKLAAKKLIDEGIHSIAGKGLKADSIIETWHDINKAVNWNSYTGGKKDLAKLKIPLKTALQEIDPSIAKNFETLNEGWGKMKNLEKKLSPNKFKNFYNYGKIFGLGSGIVQGVSTGNWSIASGILGTELTQRISTKMLTDPKYQNLFLKMGSAINNGSKLSGLKAMKEFSDAVIEDFPEEARQVDWKEMIGES